MKIHKEGTVIISVAFFLIFGANTLVASYFSLTVYWFLVIVSIVFFFLIVYFFRKPNRHFNIVADGVLSPCDGKVVVIEEVEETEFLHEKCIQVSIFMSPLNVHINWYPIDGKVLYSKHHSGKFYKAWLPKASTDNERATVVVEGKEGKKILVRQIAGAVARRIVTYAKQGNIAKQGGELGFIKFGSRVDIFLPLDAQVNVSLNEKVRGLQSVIATF